MPGFSRSAQGCQAAEAGIVEAGIEPRLAALTIARRSTFLPQPAPQAAARAAKQKAIPASILLLTRDNYDIYYPFLETRLVKKFLPERGGLIDNDGSQR